MTVEARAWREAVEILRSRGYLRRRGERAPRHGGDLLEAAVAALLLAGGAVIAGTAGAVPGRAFALVLLLPSVLAGVVTTWFGVELAADRAHRAGLPAGRAAAAGGLLAGAVIGTLWVLAVHDPPLPHGPVRAAGAAAAVFGVMSVVRVVARRVVFRALAADPEAVPGLPRRAWLAAAGALVVVVGVAAVRPVPVPPAVASERIAVAPGRTRLAVLAVDGLRRDDLEVLSPEIAGWGWARLAPPLPHSLPVAWVTVAAGTGPEVHGVVSVDQLLLVPVHHAVLAAPVLHRVLAAWSPLGLVAERAVPAAQRRVPTVWEMASRAGLTVRVVGWWGSFPPRRVTGLVLSERWLLAGTLSSATVWPFPPAEPIPGGGSSPLEIDRRTAGALHAADPRRDRLVMGYFPGWWLEATRVKGGPLATAARLRPHGDLLTATARELAARGWAVWITALGDGWGWVAASSAAGGRHADVPSVALAPTWLDALGVPIADNAAAPRRDLSGISGPPPRRARYGPPPPLAGAPVREGGAQLELLRTLGYLD